MKLTEVFFFMVKRIYYPVEVEAMKMKLDRNNHYYITKGFIRLSLICFINNQHISKLEK